MRGEHGPFLPGQEVAAEVSRKVDAVIGFEESFEGAFVVVARSGNPGARDSAVAPFRIVQFLTICRRKSNPVPLRRLYSVFIF
jgi:hypothetical protein